MLSQKLAAIEHNRAVNGKLPGGVAPEISSSSFRFSQPKGKSKAKRWDHHLSRESRCRSAGTLKACASKAVKSGPPIINLGTARPLPDTFPWISLSMECFDSSGQAGPKTLSCSSGEEGYDLEIALNYGYAAGSPQLVRFITEHVEMIHDPLYDDWATCMTSGTTSALEMLFRMLCERGDTILAESYTYSGATEAAKPLGISMFGIPIDDQGLLAEEMDQQLRNWDESKGPKPRVLYTIPSGQNPTGVTQGLERRKAILDVAEEHDLLIIEDDPYYFLHYGDCKEDFDGYLAILPPSLLSLDRTGRVLRLDATSKILSPGLRCGWLTGCEQLITRFLQHADLSSVAPSGPVQVMLYKLLDENWGHEGFIRWLQHLSIHYQLRRDTMIEACERYLPGSPICRWRVPESGMFVWICLNLTQHPGRGRASALAIEERIFDAAKALGVQVIKGSWFGVKPKCGEVGFRMTFAAAPKETLEEAVRRLAEAVRYEFKIECTE